VIPGKEITGMKFYSAERISDQLTVIRSLTGELLYLVEGEDQAALIDTGAGVGHLKNLVDTLTDKPLIVLLTHGHVDHAPGAPEFETVYLNGRDNYLYRRQCALEERKGYLKAGLGPRFSELDDSDFVPPMPDKAFMPLEDGMTFDLGGVHIDVYALPGHTPGCMVLLLRELRTLILGDACNNSTFLFDGDASPLAVYRENLDRVRTLTAGKFDHVYLSHHDIETGVDIMDNVLELIDEVMAGRGDDIPFEFMGMHAFIARKCSERFQREDGVCGNFIYDKAKLYAK